MPGETDSVRGTPSDNEGTCCLQSSPKKPRLQRHRLKCAEQRPFSELVQLSGQ